MSKRQESLNPEEKWSIRGEYQNFPQVLSNFGTPVCPHMRLYE